MLHDGWQVLVHVLAQHGMCAVLAHVAQQQHGFHIYLDAHVLERAHLRHDLHRRKQQGTYITSIHSVRFYMCMPYVYISHTYHGEYARVHDILDKTIQACIAHCAAPIQTPTRRMAQSKQDTANGDTTNGPYLSKTPP